MRRLALVDSVAPAQLDRSLGPGDSWPIPIYMDVSGPRPHRAALRFVDRVESWGVEPPLEMSPRGRIGRLTRATGPSPRLRVCTTPWSWYAEQVDGFDSLGELGIHHQSIFERFESE